jgi:Putative transmembrane protein (PGPGW)
VTQKKAAVSEWHHFWHDRPGRRFMGRYHRHAGRGKHVAGRVVRAVVSVVLILVGIVFMALPGPGFVPVLAGLALLAGDSRRLAAALDRLELKVRGWLHRG